MLKDNLHVSLSGNRNSLDFTVFETSGPTPQSPENVTPIPTLTSTNPKSNSKVSSGNYRFSNATHPVFIVISADERSCLTARFFCTWLKHFLSWSGESAKLLIADPNERDTKLVRFAEQESVWRECVRRCIGTSLDYFDSDPKLGFAATPVSIIFVDCNSKGSFDAFHAELPVHRSFLIRHFWFGEEWHQEHVHDCGYVSVCLPSKCLRASRCRGSVICSRITSFLNSVLPCLCRVYLHEAIEGDPQDTLSFNTPIFFTRHGQSEYNLEDRLGGDPDLTESGRQDAIDIGTFFLKEVVSNPLLFKNRTREWDENVGFEVWCSQLCRTRHTAEPSSLVLSGGKVRMFKSLNEIHAGICEDMTNDEVKRIYPHIQAFRKTDKVGFRYPNGESYQDLARRLTPLLIELMNAQPCTLVVAHQAVLRTILSFFGGAPVEKAVHLPCPQRTVWVCTYNRLGEPRLAEIALPPREGGAAKEATKWSGW
ncbi:fructose-6-phosphate2-kinase/fructose-2,6-bisph os phatase-likeprotein [Angomonas deanei]|nr:fructose-6-phosphate2-kinase/fructose-2,6-bisph os phatase-likeprotein [Angomonas deanei]EPY41823.1 fructose-6-phosphate2-kinase/fructose-2,6-bisph os phatase-likeprotein [Angomonas deanei]|eukprot:EPY37991.1 fructose-6-phosphate2-kinase/fructose-2,6-bisph os phatase-likeprotein [Angomonas deanei]